MLRWSQDEITKVAEMRDILSDELKISAQYPEVVGDRKFIRFLRGHEGNIKKATEMMSKFLKWRKTVNADQIRHDIVFGGKNHPSMWPNANNIIKLVPQIVLSFEKDRLDNFGCPISLERYDFSPSNVLKNIKLEEYLLFVLYSLEYKSVILEQLSEASERSYLALHQNDEDSVIPYGVILNICVIRDLSGVGWEHIGSQGLDIIRAVMSIATDNYPELMRKCFMINTPWLFHTVWYLISGLIPQRTLGKISVLGGDFAQQIRREIGEEALPNVLGGNFNGETPPFPFDTSVGGLLWPESGVQIPKQVPAIATSEASESESEAASIFMEIDRLQEELMSSGSRSRSRLLSLREYSSEHFMRSVRAFHYSYRGRQLVLNIKQQWTPQILLERHHNPDKTSNGHHNGHSCNGHSSAAPVVSGSHREGVRVYAQGVVSPVAEYLCSKLVEVANSSHRLREATDRRRGLRSGAERGRSEQPVRSNGGEICGSVGATLEAFITGYLSSESLQGKKLLDLSCGVGLSACVCGMLGIDVLAAECDEEQCMHVAENLACNMPQIALASEQNCGAVSLLAWPWGSSEDCGRRRASDIFARFGDVKTCLLLDCLGLMDSDLYDSFHSIDNNSLANDLDGRLLATIVELWTNFPAMVLLVGITVREESRAHTLSFLRTLSSLGRPTRLLTDDPRRESRVMSRRSEYQGQFLLAHNVAFDFIMN